MHAGRLASPDSVPVAAARIGLGLLSALVTMWGLGCGESSAPSALPDVIVLTLDTTRADHLGIYGYEREISPNIDGFARDAIVFDRAWTTSPWTLPSHASIFTGKHPTSHGAHYDATGGDTSIHEVLPFVPEGSYRANRLAEAEVTLAELLKERGYETAAFVGGHWLAPEFGLMQGYDTVSAKATTLGGRPAPELNAEAIAWLKATPRSRPLHLLVNYFDAHDPYNPVPGFDKLSPLANPSPDPKVRKLVDAYDCEIQYMDHHVGELLEALRQAGRFENAVIVMVSDHGELFGEHGLFNHRPWLFEELTRAVMIVRRPDGREAGTRDERPTSIVDLLPLIAAEVGFALPEDVEGLPLGARELVVAEARPNSVAVRKHGDAVNRSLTSGIRWPWKLISSSRGKKQLYRLDRDPRENEPLDTPGEMQELSDAIDAAVSAMTPPASVQRAKSDTPETEANLRALGYIE